LGSEEVAKPVKFGFPLSSVIWNNFPSDEGWIDM
jgi:hypothetical protein